MNGKKGVIKTLVHETIQICEEKYLQEELKHLEIALRDIGYTQQEIKWTLLLKTINSTKSKEQTANS